MKAGGAVLLRQDAFSPERLAADITALAGDAGRLGAMALAARSAGSIDAAARLADLVLRVGGLSGQTAI
jgi:UDP-N-acetylglucosamine--N-acetylmuramyl-(pentapeptide) pyrophosphoryl-undecaprenol N-acetylglucosamine transferase